MPNLITSEQDYLTNRSSITRSVKVKTGFPILFTSAAFTHTVARNITVEFLNSV